MPSRRDEPDVWYAAYGSNIERARLGFYLVGGTHPLTGRVTPGCRDRTPPGDDRGVELAHPVRFGRHSTGWEGGIAFLDDRARGRTLGRAWRVGLSQLADIVAQENGREPGTIDVPADDLGPERPVRRVLPDGWYGRVLWCGEIDGLPVLTCTADWDLAAEPPSPPSGTYLATIARGLREVGHPADEIVSYLHGLEGVRPAWTRDQVAALVSPVA